MTTAHAALTTALGHGRIRPAHTNESVGGVCPQWVAIVDSTEQVATTMRVASEHGLRVIAMGSGSKLHWGATPDDVDLVVDISGITGIVEHAAGDLVLRARAGTTLSEIHSQLRDAGQQLAIDHPLPSATVGGVIATGLSGPGRHLFGGVRDLLIGITVVLPDATVATSGGKVVKNVAGYDLARLYTGSYGTLGVITEAVFRLHPLAAEYRWITIPTTSVEPVLRVLRHTQAAPTAIEVDQPGPGVRPTICARLEGRPDTTQTRAAELAEALHRASGDAARVLDQAPKWWGTLPFEPDEIGLRIGVAASEVPRLLTTLRQAESPLAIRGAAGLGVVHAGLPATAPPNSVARLVSRLRDTCAYVVLEQAPRPIRDVIDPWGPANSAVYNLMRRTKEQFDPEHRLAAGRFIGGI